MPQSTTLLISRVSRNNTECLVEYAFSGDTTVYTWSCPSPESNRALHHELIVLRFLTNKLEVFCSEIIGKLEISCSVGFSKTFHDVIALIQLIEPSLQGRINVNYEPLTLVHPVLELWQQKQTEEQQAFVPSLLVPQPMVNVRIIDGLLTNLIMNFDRRLIQGRAFFSESLFWTIENSRHTYKNGYAATRSFLNVFERAIRSLIGQEIEFLIDFVDDILEYRRLSGYSDRPEEFEACMQSLSHLISSANGEGLVSSNPVQGSSCEIDNWHRMDDLDRRSAMSTLPTGLEPMLHKYLPGTTVKENSAPRLARAESSFFWTKKGWAYFGASLDTRVSWGILYE